MKNKFVLAHIGINQNSSQEAKNLSDELSKMFNLNTRSGQKSEFAGEYFECMRNPYLGVNGHIAMLTDDLELAVKELKEKGYSFLEETASYTENGKLKNIYLDGEWGGFAIHILQK